MTEKEVKKKKQIIAFCGRAGSGKDYNCHRLQKNQHFTKLAFADILRSMAFNTLKLEEVSGEEYTNLKSTQIYNKQNFRNILENLGSTIRKHDEDFFVRTLIKNMEKLGETNICISDLRYANEYMLMYEHSRRKGYIFKLVFCDYKSDRYEEKNDHESAKLANWLSEAGCKDQQIVDHMDLVTYRYTEEKSAN